MVVLLVSESVSVSDTLFLIRLVFILDDESAYSRVFYCLQ